MKYTGMRRTLIVVKLLRQSIRMMLLQFRRDLLNIRQQELENELERLGQLEARLWLTVEVRRFFAPGILPKRFDAN